MKNVGREVGKKLEKRSRGHRTSNNRALFKTVRGGGSENASTARLFPSEIAFRPSNYSVPSLHGEQKKKKKRGEEKKHYPRSAINTQRYTEKIEACTTTTPSNIPSPYGIQFGIRSNGGGEEEQVVVRAAAANET